MNNIKDKGVRVKTYWHLKMEVGFILGFTGKDIKNFFELLIPAFITTFIVVRILGLFYGLTNIVVFAVACVVSILLTFMLTVPERYIGVSIYEKIIKKYIAYAKEENEFTNEE